MQIPGVCHQAIGFQPSSVKTPVLASSKLSIVSFLCTTPDPDYRMPSSHQRCLLLLFGPSLIITARNVEPLGLRYITSERHGQAGIRQRCRGIGIASEQCL